MRCRARLWWRTPLIPALGTQRQADFWVRGQPGLQSELQDSQGYTEKLCLKKTKQQNKTNKQAISLHASEVAQQGREPSSTSLVSWAQPASGQRDSILKYRENLLSTVWKHHPVKSWWPISKRQEVEGEFWEIVWGGKILRKSDARY